MNSQKKYVVTPRLLVELVMKMNEIFHCCETHHDAHEFLIFLLNSLDEQTAHPSPWGACQRQKNAKEWLHIEILSPTQLHWHLHGCLEATYLIQIATTCFNVKRSPTPVIYCFLKVGHLTSVLPWRASNQCRLLCPKNINNNQMSYPTAVLYWK